MSNELTPNDFKHIFLEHPIGTKIWDFLEATFYNVDAFDQNPYQMAYNEGRRSVIHYLLVVMAQTHNPSEEGE